MEDEIVLEGMVSVRAALMGEMREVSHIFIRKDKWDKEAFWLEKTADSRNIPLTRIPKADIAAKADGKSHGGVLAIVGERTLFSMHEMLDLGQPNPFIVMIDGVEDPYNFGQAVRSLYAVGCHAVVLRERNWLSATAVVARASAGATERMPMGIVETADSAAAFFKANGLTLASMAKDNATLLPNANLTQPLFLLVGGEKRGVTRSFLKIAEPKGGDQPHLRLAIPYARNEFRQSLGTTAAAAMIGYEVMRQRTDM